MWSVLFPWLSSKMPAVYWLLANTAVVYMPVWDDDNLSQDRIVSAISARVLKLIIAWADKICDCSYEVMNLWHHRNCIFIKWSDGAE